MFILVKMFGFLFISLVPTINGGICPVGVELKNENDVKMQCENVKDCRKGSQIEYSVYCHEGTCCDDENDFRKARCPDYFLNIYNEQECVTGRSGHKECLKKGGRCVAAINDTLRCCPGNLVFIDEPVDAKESPKVRRDTHFPLPPYTYVTGLDCDPKFSLTLGHKFTYCDDKLRKVVYIGLKNSCDEKQTYSETKCDFKKLKCPRNFECVPTYDGPICFKNPLKCIEQEEMPYDFGLHLKINFLLILITGIFASLYFQPIFWMNRFKAFNVFYNLPGNEHSSLFELFADLVIRMEFEKGKEEEDYLARTNTTE